MENTLLIPVVVYEKRYVEGDWLCLYTLPKGEEERYDDKALALGRYYVRLAVSIVLADSPREEDLSITGIVKFFLFTKLFLLPLILIFGSVF